MTNTSVNDGAASAGGRKVGAALGIGILLLPWIFAWFLLRKGYSTRARLIAFGWMFAALVIVLMSGSGAEPVATASPKTEALQAPPEADSKLTGPQKHAVRSAKQYLDMSGFSRDGLINQLSSSAGDGYDLADATAAVDSLDVDWNANAVRSARQYLSMTGFSCRGLIEQLSSSAGEKFTESQATFGAREAGACS